MKGWIIFLALCTFCWTVVYVSKLLHNLSPSLTVVEDKTELSNLEAEKLGYKVTENRTYFRKVTYKERKQTKGFFVEVKRDTVDNHVYYNEDK